MATNLPPPCRLVVLVVLISVIHIDPGEACQVTIKIFVKVFFWNRITELLILYDQGDFWEQLLGYIILWSASLILEVSIAILATR